MPAFKGRTSTNALSTAYNVVSRIKSFSIVNKTGGAVTVNVGIIFGSTYNIIPYNKSLAAGEAYIYSGEEIKVPSGHAISITASGQVDYYFSIE